MTTSDLSSGSGSSETVVTLWQRHGRRIWWFCWTVLILTMAITVAWWFLFAPVVVTMHTVATGTVIADVMGTGTLEARTSAIVGSKIGGLITRIAVDEGDRVKAGQLLIQLEDSDLRQQVGMTESEVAAGVAALERLRADGRRAEAVLVQARLSHDRVAELSTSMVASQQDVDKAREALSIAEAGWSLANAAIVEGEKRLVVAERSLEFHRARLQDTTIEAPFDGLVVRRDRESGDVVTPGASVLQVVATDELWITAWVDETELGRLQEDQPARIVFRSEPDTAYRGVVVRIGHEADRETRELVVDVRVERRPARWAVGQRAEVYIEVARRDGVTTLPAGAVIVQDGKTGVMVADGGKARWREIVVGLRGREMVEVQSGLSPGENVLRPAGQGAGLPGEGRRIRPQ